MTARADLLVRGGTVVTMDDSARIVDDAVVAVCGGTIVEVAPASQTTVTEASRVIEVGHCVIVPGFVNAHTHSVFSLTRGLEPELALEPWLEHVFAEAEHIGPDEARAGAALSYLEMLESGITTCVDHHYAQSHPLNAEAVLEAAAASGMRVILAPTAPEAGSGAMDDDAVVAMFNGLEERLADLPSDRLSIWGALASPGRRESKHRCRLIRELVKDRGTRLTYHYAESRDWYRLLNQYDVATLIDLLARFGLLGPDVVIAHGVWFGPEEVSRLAESDTAVSYNPVSNMYLADGVAPVVAMREAGVRVALGTDAANCNNRCDPFEVMKVGALLQKVSTLDASVVTAYDVLAMATIGGAAALGVDDRLGSIEVGKDADLVVVDVDRPHLTPVHDIVRNLVYAARPDDVVTVIVGGDVVVEDGVATGVERAAVQHQANRAAARVLQGSTPGERLGLAP